jgi:hypothetical protein
MLLAHCSIRRRDWTFTGGRLAASSIAGFALGLLCGSGPALAADPLSGNRSLAMGDTLRAYASGSEGALLNPSGIAVTRQFSSAAFYSLRTQSLGHSLHASLADSITQEYLAIGIYYNYIHESPHFAYRLGEGGMSSRVVTIRDSDIVRSGSEAGIVVAIPFADRFAVGAIVKYGSFSTRSQLQPSSVPGDFSYANPAIDGDHSVDLGSTGSIVSFDLGATLRLISELRVAVVGQNLWAHGFEFPSRLGLGLSYKLGDRLLVAGDAVIDCTSAESCVAFAMDTNLCSQTAARRTYRLGAGAEYVIAGVIPFRAGYLYDQDYRRHHISGGLGYLDLERGFGIDLSFRQSVSSGSETVLLAGFRVLKQ